MRIIFHYAAILLGFFVSSCSEPEEKAEDHITDYDAISASFDGADYTTEAEMVLHGQRLASIFACNDCHLPDYSGVNFGELVPILEGLWATNISLTMPMMTDEELEWLLREGVHPNRELFLMPSKQSQFLSHRDMSALIAYLRTVPPTGDPTPLPPEDFRDALSSRLPPDYWRKDDNGDPYYHTAEDEALYFKKNALPGLGEEYAKGRLIAQSVCTACHGAALDGVGEMAGSIRKGETYSKDAFERLLRDDVTSEGQSVKPPYANGHVPSSLTDNEIQAVIAYILQLLKTKPVGNQRVREKL